MALFDVLGHLFSAAITIFFAFSPGIAVFTAYTSDNENGTATEVAGIPEQKPANSSLFEAFSDIIRTQLHTDDRYQQAAVAGVLATSSPITTTPIEAALVNMFCTARREGAVRTVTGSGAFIDEHGIILTNAHIAQFLLLTGDIAQTTARCVVRQGSPAVSRYEADLLYISPAWIAENASQLSAENPSGTGEHDFALLYVTDALDGDMPETFPSLTPAPTSRSYVPMAVRAAGYPAEMLTADDTHAPLVPTIVATHMTHLFTFGTGDIDLMTIAPSIVGQQGSSGGPIVDENGSIVGLIVTRGNTGTEGKQSLRALTLPYIDRTLAKDTGLDLAHTIAGDVVLRATVFRETIAPYLRALLLDML